MVRSVPATLKALKNALYQPDAWLWLYEVRNPDGGPVTTLQGEDTILRLTNNSEPVNFGLTTGGKPITWYPWHVEMKPLGEDAEANVTPITLTFANTLDMARAFAEANDNFRDHQVLMHLVSVAALSDPNAKWTLRTTVVRTGVDDSALTLSLSAFFLADFDVPQSLMTRRCRWRYRGPGCFFAGDPGNAELGACEKTLPACELRGTWEEDNGLEVLHPGQFGGAPGLPYGPARVRF